MESRFLAESHRLSITGLALQVWHYRFGITAWHYSGSPVGATIAITEPTGEVLESADVGSSADGCGLSHYCKLFTWKPARRLR